MTTKVVLTGDKEMAALLKELGGKAADRIARNTLSAGARAAVKGIKKAAPKSMKPAIGSRVERAKSGEFEAKVGAGVGKAKKEGSKARAKQKSAAKLVHLFVLGTKPRFRKKLGGHYAGNQNPTQEALSTGQMTPNPFVKQGMAAAQGDMSAKQKAAFDRSVERERAKLAKK